MTPKTALAETISVGPWDLSELLSSTSEETISQALAALDQEVATFESCRSQLDAAMDPADLLAILHRYTALSERVSVLAHYGALWFSADTQNAKALAFLNRERQVATDAGNRTLFFTLWWRGLDDEQAARLLPSAPDERHYLEDLRRFRPFTLDERSEQIINVKDENGIASLLTVYSLLTNRLEFKLEVDGEVRTLTRDELVAYAFSPRSELRAALYRELHAVFGREANILGQIYVNRVRDWASENVGLRGYASPIAVRNADNDVPDAAIETLLAVTRENIHHFQRYFRIKARWLGMERLRRFDLYAPLAAAERTIPFGDAAQLVLDTFGTFHPEFGRHAERVFTERHLDSEVRKGKRGGAFCSTVMPALTPWVLINYTGKPRDVATLAHELGHAIHSMLAAGHSILTQHASLPLAETASVFGEMLLTDRLLAEDSDPIVRRELLAASVDDVYATVVRQAYFVLFELAAHRAIAEGKAVDDLHAIYSDLLREQFGETIEVAPEFRYEWLSIPHIYHTPFYCYAYSFGQLLVLALYRRFREQGESFKAGYLRLLAYGGSARPAAILAEAGIDMTDRSFWQQGFDLVGERIDELAALG
jgi:oligoendopeptidase F